MLQHVPHALVIAALCFLPLLIWLPLWLFAEDEPRTGEDETAEAEQTNVRLAA